MATGTFATLWDEYAAFVKVLDKNWNNDVIESNNFIANVVAGQATTNDNEWKSRKEDGYSAMIAGRSAALLTGALDWWIPWLENVGEALSLRGRGLQIVSTGEFFEYMHANSENVTYRNITRGSISATTSANSIAASFVITFGEDAYNYSIEDVPTYYTSSSDWVHEWLCVSDPQTGTSPATFWWYLAGTQKRHELHDHTALPTIVTMSPGQGVVSVDDVDLLTNADFSAAFSGSGADKIPGWYISAGTAGDVTANTTAGNGFAAKRGTITLDDTDGDFYQLAIARNGTTEAKVEQYIDSEIRTDVPYLCALVFKGDGTADGNMTLTLGSQSISAAVSSSYQVIYIGSSDNNDAWYRTFAADPLSVSFQRTGSPTTGTVYVHGVYLFPVDAYLAGRYGIIVEGADYYRKDDLYTATDTVGNTPAAGTSQYWWNRLCIAAGISDPRWRYLPHGSSASTDAHDYS